MMPIICTLGGDHQDSSFEGALPIYMGRKFFVQFLHKELCSSSKENIHQTNMFIILRATEMIDQLAWCKPGWPKKLVNVTFVEFFKCPFLLWDPDSTRTATF